MALKIGFFTSLGVNVGDEFIREGIRSVLDRAGFPYHPFYIHKLDANSLIEPREDEPFVLSDKYWDSDVFIQAGAPVYWHILEGRSTSLTSAWHQWMWEDRILNCARGGPVFLNLGAGACQPWDDDGTDFLADPACVEFACKASARATLTTTRDPLASHILTTLSLPHELLPCPAFLASARHIIPDNRTDLLCVNLMPRGGHYELDPAFNEAVWLMRCIALVSRLRSFGPLLFVAHDGAEAAFMSQFAGSGERVFQGSGWKDYLDVYGSSAAVVANRVHGAVCAAGFGVPAVIIGNDSRASIGDPIGIPRFKAGGEIGSVLSTLESLLNEREASRLRSLRETAMCRYVELLKPVLAQSASCIRATHPARRPKLRARATLAAVRDMEETGSRIFMGAVNLFGSQYGMRQFYDWSKVWEYPWLWLHGLGGLPWPALRLVDLGSESSPMPWLLASLGAEVVLIETDPQWIPLWQRWRQQLEVDVTWHIVDSESLPLPDDWADVITSFSVIEHQPDKAAAIEEVVRVLAPGGVFALSFDICEPSMGMTFPEWNGKALTMSEFERLVWRHPAFRASRAPEWNVDDMPAFRDWHLRSAPHHNYVVGAAVLQKATTGNPPAETPGKVCATLVPRIGIQAFASTGIKDDLAAIRDALEAYWQAHHAYPKSSGGWDGLHTNWGVSTTDWIPGLVPDYLPCLPRDPRNHDVPDQQYLYKSDGTDYKLISHGPWDEDVVRRKFPDMIDLVRPSWAYGFWTKGAKNW